MTYSYSDLLTGQRCWKKFEYSVVRRLQRKARPVNLELGTIVHELLMADYQGKDIGERANELEQEAIERGVFLDDEILTMRDLVAEGHEYALRYLEHYPDDEWEILHIEETFLVTVDGVELSFTPDLVVRDSRGVWVVDHKTSSSLPSGDLPVGNYQAFLYSAVMREIYPDFRGFIFNFIRKKIPREPRLTKTGDKRVADLKRIDTDYETLRDFLLENAPDLMDDPAHRKRLAELKDENRFFWRQYVFTTEAMDQKILEDTKVLAGMADLCEETGVYPRSFLPYAGAQECDNCQFKEICVAELRDYNIEPVMFLYEERDMSYRNYDHTEEELLNG